MNESMKDRTDLKPWDRQKGESPLAYQAFLAYRDLGEARSFVGAAHALGKSNSLVRRWATRYDWRDRAWAYDVAQAREAEEALRQQREESLRRQARDSDQLQRLAMARLSGLIRRDPASGEVSLDPGVTPRDAVTIYKLALELEDRLMGTSQAQPYDEDVTEQQLRRMSTEQLRELLALSRERAGDEVEVHDGDK